MPPLTKPLPFDRPVIFFDGHCNLCNHFVDFVFRHDKKGLFLVAPLQGTTAKEYLPQEHLTLSSVVVADKDKTFTESTAALWVLSCLSWPWPLMAIFFLLPRFLRDPIYRFIANHRYQWFGRRDTCRLPTEGEKGRFLE